MHASVDLLNWQGDGGGRARSLPPTWFDCLSWVNRVDSCPSAQGQMIRPSRSWSRREMRLIVRLPEGASVGAALLLTVPEQDGAQMIRHIAGGRRVRCPFPKR